MADLCRLAPAVSVRRMDVAALHMSRSVEAVLIAVVLFGSVLFLALRITRS